MATSARRSDEPSPGAYYGSLSDAGPWKEAIDAYYRDEMPQAYGMAQALGASFGGAMLRWYRMIEGEALTRERATIEEIAPWLSVEWDASELHLHAEHRDAIREACEGVGRRLGWDFSAPVRVTVMLAEVDAPWHGARFGYCIDKQPFDKICLPLRAASDPSALRRVVSHEFTHVVTLNLTGSRMPHWLDEGLALLMEGSAPGFDGWMEPGELNGAFETDRWTDEGLHHSQDAYGQAAVLVQALAQRGGDEKLAQLLRAFTDNSFWTEIKINVLGESSADEALREVYGIGENELFEETKR